MRLSLTVLLLAGASAPTWGAKPASPKAAIDPLDCRWTFGNHEPVSMYRRAGGRTTGGIEGSALWLEEWHHWFDSEACAQLMQDLGLNFLHCRFYKGMGWQYQSRDFPNVKQLAENCHKHGIRVLAYIQFSTLYQEWIRFRSKRLTDLYHRLFSTPHDRVVFMVCYSRVRWLAVEWGWFSPAGIANALPSNVTGDKSRQQGHRA